MKAEVVQEENARCKEKNLREIVLQVLFAFLQLTWGLPQTLAGLLVFLRYAKCPHRSFHLACHTAWRRDGYGLSLGLFIFTDADAGDHFIAHEYGHSIQSLLLGPFYIPVVGIPSLIWCLAKPCRAGREKNRKTYFSFYTEAWAERIADRYRG